MSEEGTRTTEEPDVNFQNEREQIRRNSRSEFSRIINSRLTKSIAGGAIVLGAMVGVSYCAKNNAVNPSSQSYQLEQLEQLAQTNTLPITSDRDSFDFKGYKIEELIEGTRTYFALPLEDGKTIQTRTANSIILPRKNLLGVILVPSTYSAERTLGERTEASPLHSDYPTDGFANLTLNEKTNQYEPNTSELTESTIMIYAENLEGKLAEIDESNVSETGLSRVREIKNSFNKIKKVIISGKGFYPIHIGREQTSSLLVEGLQQDEPATIYIRDTNIKGEKIKPVQVINYLGKERAPVIGLALTSPIFARIPGYVADIPVVKPIELPIAPQLPLIPYGIGTN